MKSIKHNAIIHELMPQFCLFQQPEGIEQCYTTSRLFDINNSPEVGRSEQNDVQQTMQIVIPDGIIPGSEKATVHAYGIKKWNVC